MRLNKYLAHAGIASRRKCDDLITAGYVKVNGKKVTKLGTVIDEHTDEVHFKGRKVPFKEKYTYVVLNKPVAVVSTAMEQFKRPSVVDLVAIPERIYPVGRLDYETTGVLLLTNDGQLTNRLLHPKYKVLKEYRLLLDRKIRPVDLHKLQRGVMLEEQKTLPCVIEEMRIIENKSFLRMELREGRNRQIRKMFELFHYEVLELERISFAGITTKGLKRGEWRYLAANEISKLKERVSNGN
ncbi:MAG: pseudouridine synthase [Caldithrix sp.]|nr:pseudouridine synthase [Caldithrix sp.]